MRVLVVTPTYQERDSLPVTLARLRAAVPHADVLVVDDNSPDGTGEVADRLAADDPAVRVLHRPGKDGLGTAYRAGFAWGLAQGYDVLVEMDADGSHQPHQLPLLLDRLGAADRPDLVIGSRWVPGGSVRNWPLRRQALSRGANLYARIALGLGVQDATAGFRAYRREVLEKLELAEVTSQGYCFQVDLTLRAVTTGFSVAEVPIEFVEREQGVSKMSGAIVREALVQIVVWGVRRRADQARAGLARRREGRWHR